MRALVASGTGRYSDPWHPFARTSLLLADTLHEAGFLVNVDEDVDHALSELSGVDLLVVNAGDPWRKGAVDTHVPVPDPTAFTTALRAGIGVLAMHCAVSSLRDYPEWFPAIGGMWIPQVSSHPPASMTSVFGGRFPSGLRVPDFDVFDERYCRLQQLGERHVVATHQGDPEPEPTAWVRRHGPSRIAVDVLGHDEQSYESAGHRHLIALLAKWASAQDGVAIGTQ